jgi:hypothetical protein
LWVVGPGLGRSRGLGKLVNSPSLRPYVLPSARFGVRVIFMFHLLCSFLFSFASLRISNFLPLVTALCGLAFTRVDSLSLALSRASLSLIRAPPIGLGCRTPFHNRR